MLGVKDIAFINSAYIYTCMLTFNLSVVALVCVVFLEWTASHPLLSVSYSLTKLSSKFDVEFL